MRKLAYALAALILTAWSLSPLRADTFAATYRELARSAVASLHAATGYARQLETLLQPASAPGDRWKPA